VERELVFSGSCDSCAGVGAGALEALVTVAMCVFSPQSASTLAASRLDQRFEKDCFEVLVSDGLGKRGERSGFVLSSSILSSNRTSIVACMGYLGLDTRGNPAFTGVSYY